MEQVLVSSPTGRSEWELEQNPPLGFLLLDTNKGATLPQGDTGSRDPGLDFCKGEKELVSLSLDEILQENALCLDDLFRSSRYPWDKGAVCSVLQWETPSIPAQDFPRCTSESLSVCGSVEDLLDLSGSPCAQGPACPPDSSEDELSVGDQDFHHGTAAGLIHFLSGSEELIHFSDAQSPLQVLAGTPTSSREDLSLLEIKRLECTSTCSSIRPHDGEVLSPETGDERLFSELASDLLTLYSCFPKTSAGTTESDQASSSSPFTAALDGSACCPEIGAACCDRPPGLTDGEGVRFSPENPDPAGSGPGTNVSSLGPGEDPSTPPCPPALPPQVRKRPPDRDAPCQGDLDSGWGSDPDPLMEEGLPLDLHVSGPGLFPDQRLTAESVCDGETLHPRPPDETQCEAASGPELHVRHSALHIDLEFPKDALCHEHHFSSQAYQDPGSKRTSEQTLAGLSLPGEGVCSALSVGGCESHREGDLFPLRAVFSALDQDRDGFVQIEEFLQFAKTYGAEQVKDLTRFLDPSGLGVISFEDFYRGIRAIGNGDPQLCDMGLPPREEPPCCPEEYDDYAAFEQNEVTDSAYLGSESNYSEYETLADEEAGALARPELHEELETDSAIEAALNDPEEEGRRLSLGSELNSVSLGMGQGPGEVHFEDFGEGNEAELIQDAPLQPEVDSSPAGLGQHPRLLLSPSADPFPASFQSFLREELLDFFCSQCHKQISRLEDLSTRLNFLEMNRHLLQAGPSDDLTHHTLDLADTDLTDKVMYLEKRVSELEQDSASSTEQHARLRQENLQLVHRANALEEELKEQEALAEEDLQFEVRRQKEALGKLERDRGMELENLQTRLQQLDEENNELRSCVSCLRVNIERLEEEKRKLQDENEAMADRLNEELEVQRKVSDKLSYERHKSQKEKECTQELIEDLRKQLELLQLFKLEVEVRTGRSASAGLQEYHTRTREAELEQEVRRLKQDNRGLKEQNDELNGQIITLSIQGAKNLFAASFSESLAAEINSVSRDELMEAIHKQEEINYRLQDYIDRIIVAIMESNPSILEVK
ncbi:rab11 family-interacting protein 3-like [Conger conger]|uniref:rab11 family-interacting protein 3-like n=1 Tax=Conger conger TaxID=82655 RepID=UPI002A59E04E|nr:rab11 family-interacting protein 3-like [Conger conger]